MLLIFATNVMDFLLETILEKLATIFSYIL